MKQQLKEHLPLGHARVIELQLALAKCDPSKSSRVKYLEDLIELNKIIIQAAENVK